MVPCEISPIHAGMSTGISIVEVLFGNYIGYPQDISDTIVPLGISWPASHHCGLWPLLPAKIIDCFSPLVAHIAPLDTMRGRPQGGDIKVSSSQTPQKSCVRCGWCLQLSDLPFSFCQAAKGYDNSLYCLRNL